MHRPHSPVPNTEEQTHSVYRQMGVYAPFVWLAVLVMRLGVRAGFISPEFLMPPRPEITPHLMHRNRQLRRARASCLRRARAHALKGRKIKPENYAPRAYAHYAYIDRMDKSITPAQFREHYIRDNNLSRVQVYGMDTAHEITGYVHRLSGRLAGVIAGYVDALGLTSMSLDAHAGRAPP